MLLISFQLSSENLFHLHYPWLFLWEIGEIQTRNSFEYIAFMRKDVVLMGCSYILQFHYLGISVGGKAYSPSLRRENFSAKYKSNLYFLLNLLWAWSIYFLLSVIFPFWFSIRFYFSFIIHANFLTGDKCIVGKDKTECNHAVFEAIKYLK